MTVIPSLRSFRVIGCTAVLTGLLVVSESQSRPQPGNKAAKMEVKVKEAAALQEAYVLMAGANHDYDGHRVHAMEKVEQAIKLLDHSIMKNGTKGQKVVATQQEIVAGRAAFIARHQGRVHEGQGLSDLQMKAALQILANVRVAVAQHKEKKVHQHVNHAIQQAEIALKIR